MLVKLPYKMVLLVRSENEKTPLVVLPHEIELLRTLHGDEAVREIDSPAPEGLTECEFDTADEYGRLEQNYRGDVNGQSPVRAAFGSLKEFEASFESVGSSLGDKEALIEQAKELGIAATKNWGIEKLQAAIDAALEA